MSIAIAVLVVGSALAIVPTSAEGRPLPGFPAMKPPASYTVTFNERGLPAGTNWSVSITGKGPPPRITNTSNGTSLQFVLNNGKYDFWVVVYGFTVSPQSGSFAVNGANLTENLDFSPLQYLATFQEQGLPPDTNWSVVLSGMAQWSVGPSISFSVPNGTYVFTSNASGYAAVPSYGTIVIDGAPGSVTLAFVQVEYTATFVERGLPTGTNWSVIFAGSSQTSVFDVIAFEVPSGTYSFSVTNPPGFLSTPANGSLYVSGGPASESIVFTPNLYPVTFYENDLASDANWSVTFNGTTVQNTVLVDPTTNSSSGTWITFEAPNGTFAFAVASSGYWPSVRNGYITVSGALVTENLLFTRSMSSVFSVTFTESGLPPGSPWSVNLNGSLQATNGPSVTFEVTNGTFGYTVGGGSGFTAVPTSGTVSVSGLDVALVVTFLASSPGIYLLTFTESGLPAGTTWTLSIDSGTLSSATSVIGVRLANGTYPYSLGPVGAFYGSPGASGSITVAGNPLSVSLAYEYTCTVSFVVWGLVGGSHWSVAITNPSQPTDSQSSRGETITFHLPNGTYQYSIGNPNGTAAEPPTGVLTVSGSGVTQWVTLGPGPSSGSEEPWWVLPAVVIAAALANVSALIAFRRRPNG